MEDPARNGEKGKRKREKRVLEEIRIRAKDKSSVGRTAVDQ